ncbi:hypothetical protein [Bdellovibrio sp. HCB337]|uniref:hypothetical protein n=1 Tax=Bdellovibrio sp. HCB337 TaxID=3394358 RepID=UPI0039A44D31
MKTFAALIVTLMMIFTASCEFVSPGTNTGNPGKDPQNGDDSGQMPGMDSSASGLAAIVCLKVDACDSQSLITACYAQVTQLQGYTQELGATASGYATIKDLADAEGDQTVSPNITNYNSCTNAIRNLSCTDPLIQSAYTSADPTNFTNTNLLFRASTTCTQIY